METSCETCGLTWNARPRELCPRCMVEALRNDKEILQRRIDAYEESLGELRESLTEMNDILFGQDVEAVDPLAPSWELPPVLPPKARDN